MPASDRPAGWEKARVALVRGPRMGAVAVFLCALLSFVPRAIAIESVHEGDVAPKTGNPWIDARLLDMGAYASRYRDAFVDEIVRYHEAPRALVEEALADDAMTAGDVYFACSLAQAIGRPCRIVVDAWRHDASDGWEGVGARMGVAPLAGIHRRIRGDIAESYVRWARPLDSSAPSRP